MKAVSLLVPLTVALLCSLTLAADKEAKTADAGKSKPLFGTLAEAPAGGDAKILGVFKTSIKHEDKTINVIAASDDVAAQIKDLVKKAAKVKIMGDLAADNSSITVSKIAEATADSKTGHGHGKDKGAGQ